MKKSSCIARRRLLYASLHIPRVQTVTTGPRCRPPCRPGRVSSERGFPWQSVPSAGEESRGDPGEGRGASRGARSRGERTTLARAPARQHYGRKVMRTGRVWLGACLGLALVLSAQGLQAQQDPEKLGQPTRRSVIGPAATVPDMGAGSHVEGHEAHAEGHEAHEEHESEGEAVQEGGLVFDATYLLVRPRRRPFDFVIKDPNTNLAPEGPVGELDWDTMSNFRVGAGYRLQHGWEFAGFYTYIHSHDNQGLVRDPNGSLFATL